MDDLEREAATLRLKTSDTLHFPRIIGHKRVAGPYRYTVSMLALNGSWSRIKVTYDRDAALAILGRFPDGECCIEMHDSVTEDKVAETGRGNPALWKLLSSIYMDIVLIRESGRKVTDSGFTREQLSSQYVAVYRMLRLPVLDDFRVCNEFGYMGEVCAN